MKYIIGVFVLLIALFCPTSLAENTSIDLASLTSTELLVFSNQIDEVIKLYHEPDSFSKDIALSVTKEEVESYFSTQGIEVTWAWIDYSYTRNWDYYTLSTHIDYKDSNKKAYKPNVYAELFPENGEYTLYYLLIGTEVLINRRNELPGVFWNEKPESIINDSTGADLAIMTVQELEDLKKRISDEYKASHTPKSSVTDMVLSLTEIAIEDYFEKQGYTVSWAWFDYEYTREWDFYSLKTPITYKNDAGSHKAEVYAEAYPFNSQYILYYLSVNEEILIDNRMQLPVDLYEHVGFHEEKSTISVDNIVSDKKIEVTTTPIIEPKPTATPVPSVLTPETSTEFYNVLCTKNNFDPIIKNFAQKYYGYTIEFDGNIAYISNHGDDTFRFDILVYAGDYSETSVSGPSFQFENVAVNDWSVGANVHICAKVCEYDERTGLFKLDPISISERRNTSTAVNPSQYETLKPGSNGQAVLDARMKLYELGYFRKKPTQMEYTNNMKEYVKEFEKDFGLEQDGILSPEDQAILFAQSAPTPTPKKTATPNPTRKPTATPEKINTQARETWIKGQFGWGGVHKDLEKLIIKNLNDERSYEHIETTYIDIYDENMMKTVNEIIKQAGYSDRVKVGDLFIQTEFSAKNIFNATVKCTAFGIASYENNTVKLIAIE